MTPVPSRRATKHIADVADVRQRVARLDTAVEEDEMAVRGFIVLIAWLVAACGTAAPTSTGGSAAEGNDAATVIESFNEAMNRRDFDAALAYLAEEVTFGVTPQTHRPTIRTELTRYTAYVGCTLAIDSIEPSGDGYAVTYHHAEREGATCPDVGSESTVMIGVKDGKITHLP